MFIGIGMNLIRGGYASPASLFANGEQGAWYDPSDLTTLFQDSAGTTPVTAAGQSVGKMLDKSGRGNHATQATSLQRPTYQVDGAGRPYLSFDGVDDGMVTGTITPATDKAQVFAGIRKLSDILRAMLYELGPTTSTASIRLEAPNTPAATQYVVYSNGSINGSGVSFNSVPAPITSVIGGISEVSTDTLLLRINGAQVASSSADQGTGNYAANQLYIGRRGGVALAFNGNIYSMIIRFGANLTAGQITSTEAWVNGKTGAY